MKVRYREDVEMCAVGVAVMGAQGSPIVCESLAPEAFFNPAHRRIFEACQKLHSLRKLVDPVSVCAELGEDIVEVGGQDYILQCCEFVPSVGAVAGEHWSNLVREDWTARQMADMARRLARSAVRGELSEARGVVEELTNVPTAPARTVRLADIDTSQPRKGTPTGFPSLDRYTEGVGYPSGQMTVVAASAKGGKSSFLIGSACHIAAQMGRVLYASFADLSPYDLKKRILRNLSGYGERPYVHLDATADYEEAEREACAWDLEIYYGPTMGMAVEDLASHLRSEKRSGRTYDVVMVDYLQRLDTRAPNAEDSPTRALEAISRKLCNIAAELDTAIVAGSQLTPQANGRLMTKYARAVEEDGGLMFLIHDENPADPEVRVLEVKLNRFGPKGSETFRWNDRRVRFEETTT